ncbi:MFS transporter [Streptomyces sp. NPDC088258]|uniref:MFS transporter n=1 Tax=Streptomyces sp. NPDC088258 TaxID=3365849 RepID=UPI00381F95A6
MGGRDGTGLYLAGAAVARTGDEMSGPALLLAGLAVTGSAATASSLLAALTVSAAVGGPVLGVLLDRVAAPGRLLAGALAGYASVLVVVVGGLGRVPVMVPVLLAVAAGLLGPALSGGWTAQLPRLVGRAALPRATALDAMTFNVASLVGPALAGVAAGVFGARAGVVVAAALICLAVPSALALPPAPARPGNGERAGAAGRPAESLGSALTAGLGAIVRNRPLARTTATSVLSSVGAGVLVVCCPPLAARDFGAADRGALLLSVVAAAALAANAVLARLPRQPRPDTVVWCAAPALASALLLAAAGRPLLLAVAVVLAGVAEGPQLTAVFAVRHREAPERLRGRVFTIGASLKMTGFALGAALAGPLAERSLPGALLTGAAAQMLAVLAFASLRGGPGRAASV